MTISDHKPGLTLLLLFFSMITFPAMLRAQNDLVEPVAGQVKPSLIDTNYIESYTHLVSLRAYGLFQEAVLKSNSGAFNSLSYRPNTPGRLGIGGFYKWFGLGLSFGMPFLHPAESTRGKTTFYDLRANLYANQFAAEGFIQSYKGFYISDRKDKERYYLLPDMKIFSIGLYAYYFYNYKRFSIRGAFIQTERQKKSAGSLALRPFFIYFDFSAPGGMVPPELIESAQITGKIPDNPDRGHFLTVGLAPGYTYTFVFAKNFFLNAAVYPGFLYTTGSFHTNHGTEERNQMSLNTGIKAAAGYNSGKWFAGVGFSSGLGSISARLSAADFYYDVTQFRVWGGVRFDWFRKKK